MRVTFVSQSYTCTHASLTNQSLKEGLQLVIGLFICYIELLRLVYPGSRRTDVCVHTSRAPMQRMGMIDSTNGQPEQYSI
jgi:hypothetical protein